MNSNAPKLVSPIAVAPPPEHQHVKRNAEFASQGERRGRYHLPSGLESASVVGYRTRLPMTQGEVEELMPLFSLARPSGFATPEDVPEQEFFEESALGILSARQSTNFRGQRQVTFGVKESREINVLLKELEGLEAPVLEDSTYTHIAFCRPYRTPFTMLLTLVGHRPLTSLLSVPWRAFRKWKDHIDDIPTIGYLTHLHLGIFADGLERAVQLASIGKRSANILMAPFSSSERRKTNRKVIRQLEKMAGLTRTEKRQGWKIGFIAQVGTTLPEERIAISKEVCRKAGANLLAFRSERVQPGVNQEEKAPAGYQSRQEMDVPDGLTEMAGRAAYNAFSHWTGSTREMGKSLLLLDRVDVLTPNGKERLRDIREELGEVTDRLADGIPLWADLPTGRVFSKNTKRSRKAFALAGQRIYIAGLPPEELAAAEIPWELGVRAVGASVARSSLLIELSGVIDLPDTCDMLTGVCIMAGPVNQNDVGKTYYGGRDLLLKKFPDRNPCSLLIWTVKAKTIADPIGNEEQLLNPARKGALVDLRPGPHEVIQIGKNGVRVPYRQNGSTSSTERGFSDMNNFVCAPDGTDIPGNRGQRWEATTDRILFPGN